MRRQRLGILAGLTWQLIKLRFSGKSNKDFKSKRLLFDNFKHLGGVYVKFLQLLTLNVDFLKGWASTAEFEVFESVAYEPVDHFGLIRAELPEFEQHFQHIDEEPFAAGSFGQVYNATLQNGQAVIIKVLRPSLIRNLKFDLWILGLLTKISEGLYPSRTIRISELFHQFAVTTRAETDYTQELSNAMWFFNYFQNVPEIVIPQTYPHLSSPHIITQDYVGGISLVDIMQAQKAGQAPAALVRAELGSDIWRQLYRLGTELLRSSLQAEFVLGDPHPGNIKLLPDDKVGLVDFGIAARAPSNRHACLELMREYKKLYEDKFDACKFTIASLGFLSEDLVNALQTVGKIINPAKPINFMEMIGNAAAKRLTESLEQGRTQQYLRKKMMTRLFMQSINDQNRLGLDLSTQATQSLKASYTYLALVGNIGEDGENFAVISQAINDAILAAERHGLAADSPKAPLSADRSLELVSTWVARIADRDPFLYAQLTATIKL